MVSDENNNYLNISISVSVILTSELNQLKKDNELFQIRISELLKEKEILQNITLSKNTKFNFKYLELFYCCQLNLIYI